MVSKTVGVAIAIVAIAGIYFAMGGELPDQLQQTGTSSQTSTGTGFTSQTETESEALVYTGIIDMQATLANPLNATTWTDDTTADINYGLKKADGSYQFKIKSTSNSANVAAQDSGGFIYAEIEIQASQEVLMDVEGTVSGTSSVKGCVYDDFDKDNLKMYTCQIDVSGNMRETNPAITPVHAWTVSLYGEGSLALNSPTGVASISTGNVENVVEWELSFERLAVAEVLSIMRVRTNTTTSSMVNDANSFVSLPDQTIYLNDNDVTKSTDFSNTRFIYEYKWSGNVDGGKLLKVGNSGSRTLHVPTTIETGFTASTDALCVELEFVTVDARGSTTTIFDAVELTADTAVNDECTIST